MSTYKELVQSVAANACESQEATERVIKSTVAAITDRLKKGESVNIPGLGIFDTSKRAARTARNPRTGESIAVPERTAAVFRASSALKSSL